VIAHDPAHGPALKVSDTGGQRTSCGARDYANALALVELGPADRPEEADRVVLRAVALQVARNKRLVLAVLAVALGWLGPAPNQRVDPRRQRVPVLPGDRFPQFGPD